MAISLLQLSLIHICIDYLQGLNKRYEDWIKDYKGRLIIIDGDNLEFGENPEDFRDVYKRQRLPSTDW